MTSAGPPIQHTAPLEGEGWLVAGLCFLVCCVLWEGDGEGGGEAYAASIFPYIAQFVRGLGGIVTW